ncbi:beta-ketoacyl synthase [Prevotella sp. KH2C16]|uniref:beta-ketoacyl-[acyl-carrier-protein] synthase family protein n=1 Tax=Prevotella sp. KH2C16 TaxID=1855325 RepID=UPI0008E45414|nr:beta-ketoacyl-[acyl-carrier-protein] synthase family protein [Prevotella sp. KH2C16]SFF92177.1 3-oxoacyl-[acyl-carrier-protein] synthase-1 [Prevotella sp. KH2C16]
MKKRILITGAGVVSAIGNNCRECLEALQQGRSGISSVQYLKTVHKEFPVGEVKMSNGEMCRMLGISDEKPCSRTALLGILALREALADARLNGQELALVSGTTVAGMDMTEEAYPDRLSKAILEGHDCGSCTNLIADYFGCFDFTSTISTACSSALNAVIYGARLIEAGLRDIVVVGGTEALSRFHLNGFKSLMILDEAPCRPFDATRAGLNLGEGAAYLVLESEASVRERGIHPIGELKGTGNACDAFHQTASSPEGEGAFLAMGEALREAGLEPWEVQYVNAHGTGTPNNDASESAALRRIFSCWLPPVSSTKGLTGHTTSASGSIEAVFCLLALRHQFIPRNQGFTAADAECLSPYTGGSFGQPLRNVLCNSFGFGGNDSSIIIGAYGE